MIIRIRQYLLTIIVAAVICAVIRALTQHKGAPSTIIHLLTAVFLVIVVLSPWTNISFSGINEYIEKYSVSADVIVSSGVAVAQEQTNAIIKQQVEAYIEDKAMSLGVNLKAEVNMSDITKGQPESVTILANTSPYLRERISQYISADLGISEAHQVWTSKK